MYKVKKLPDYKKIQSPLPEGKVSRLYCTGCGKIHYLNLGQSQVYSWIVDHKTKPDSYEDLYFNSDSCNKCSNEFKNLQIRKIELIPLYNEISKIYSLN